MMLSRTAVVLTAALTLLLGGSATVLASGMLGGANTRAADSGWSTEHHTVTLADSGWSGAPATVPTDTGWS